MAQSQPNLASDLLAHLSTKGLSPTPTWLTTFLTTVRPNTPIAALKQTALFRILASDIKETTTFTPSSVFPPDIQDGTIKDRNLPGPLLVQVLDVEDIGTSRWSQVEAIEAQERGEFTRGREIIRVTDEADQAQQGATQAANARNRQQQQQQQPGEQKSWGPHKLLLQDARGAVVYGIELVKVDKIGLDMHIGAKLVLQNATVARGVVMLEPATVTFLGGKIDDLYTAWKEGRKDRLKAAAGMT
ncbi:RecQ mediated genome instability protein-like protein Rmi1 [Pseudovirgaria hyperparasitica]|uniref:RecQ-mediated genome instability protein 1 n=1 Tax=Pseudovirgaria hyperparasitica TaxID=470096 RepID=A0A6A6WHW8_9PEZI|nr:RecQ mediated genome instability protein-like protein Rmi1 [Pseudovirgaria hyperparasitica]KAF2760741.1 RecQ mediated genome instability protein-like protein Rmi1 [Pseudovirgaria hyperparasitica]